MEELTVYSNYSTDVINQSFVGTEPALQNDYFNFFIINPLNVEVEFYHETFEIDDISLDSINYADRFYVLSKSLQCNTSQMEDCVTVSNEELAIYGIGRTVNEAVEAFSFNFFSLHSIYALEDDENLSAEALNLKRKLTSLVLFVIE